jgi:threonine/homoserine/homoserine lactone efflux protein
MATRPSEAAGTHPARDPATSPASRRPRALGLAAAAQATEAAGLCVAAGFAAVSTADGQSHQQTSGVALTLIAIGTAALFAVFAAGLARARSWTRTPVVMTQVFVGVAGIYLLQGHRLDWGVPTLLLAACCLAALFTPASLRALNRPASPAKPPR